MFLPHHTLHDPSAVPPLNNAYGVTVCQNARQQVGSSICGTPRNTIEHMVRLRLIVLKHRGFLESVTSASTRIIELIRLLNGFLLFLGTEGSFRAYCGHHMGGSCLLLSQGRTPVTCHSKHFPERRVSYRNYAKALKFSHRLQYDRLRPSCRSQLQSQGPQGGGWC